MYVDDSAFEYDKLFVFILYSETRCCITPPLQVIAFNELQRLVVDTEDVSSQELKVFLQYQHNLGTIVYFPDSDSVILDTRWPLRELRAIISMDTKRRNRNRIRIQPKDIRGTISLPSLDKFFEERKRSDNNERNVMVQ